MTQRFGPHQRVPAYREGCSVPHGLEAAQMNPVSKPIADAKLITFAVGQQKKSRFQKAREEKELKQKLDDEETAKVYDSFVSSFTEEEDGKTFVRGGASGQRDIEGIYGGSKGDVYRMERRGKEGMSEMEKMMNEGKVGASFIVDPVLPHTPMQMVHSYVIVES